ncbi:MAG: hypothetical protein M1820_005675 [Bogoriella megaspora]|nr:MAG: hypothetical protein M1820_005675 [Bogoriella megaspora]
MQNPKSIFTAPRDFTTNKSTAETPPLVRRISTPESRPSQQNSLGNHLRADASLSRHHSFNQFGSTATLGHRQWLQQESADGANSSVAPTASASNISRESRRSGTSKKRSLAAALAGNYDQHHQEQPAKKARLHRRPRHTLGNFGFSGPSKNDHEPPSPLFFSNSPRPRPQLPPRFSSSEAAATMLTAGKEETGMKTVHLARGKFTGSSPSTRQSTGRESSDRMSTPSMATPDNSVEQEEALRVLGQVGISELLEQDDRPTFIVDLKDSANFRTSGQLHIVFANSSLRSFSGLLDLVSGKEDREPSSPNASDWAQFKLWLLSASSRGESLNTTASTASIVAVPSLPEVLSLPSAPTSQNEAGDYFGAVAPPPPVTDVPEIATTIETSGTSVPLDVLNDLKKNKSDSDISDTLDSHVSIINECVLRAAAAGNVDEFHRPEQTSGFFDWTQLPDSADLPRHVQFARSIDWRATSLGPMESWPADLRQMSNLIMASPHPAAMYWGPDLVAIYNEAYVLLAGQKHPTLMGQSYAVAWAEIWHEVKDVFDTAKTTGEATMKDDDCLFIKRSDYLEETYFSWSIIPMVGGDGSVMGLYNPAFEKTRRKIAERRMLTLREVGERTATARDIKTFWNQVLQAMEFNEFDTPFVLLYSITDESDSDSSSMHSNSLMGSKICLLEGSLGVPADHPSAPETIELKSGMEGFGPVFREILKTGKPVVLDVGTGDLPNELLEGINYRGFGDPCRAVVVCPIQPTTLETTLGMLVLGVNPRRPYDDDYSLFTGLLSRQLATSLASVVLFEEEIRRGQKAAKLAALDRIELSEQLAARTQEAIESETKFTRMAEFAPVGMFIADSAGHVTYCNDTWYEITRVAKDPASTDRWVDAIKPEDQEFVRELWHKIVDKLEPTTAEFRFKAPWIDPSGQRADTWVLFSAYTERYAEGTLKSVFGSVTNISQQKWAEGFQKRKMEEAVELKRQQENFIDITSHEMRNPLSAILQCADEISTSLQDFRNSSPGTHIINDDLLHSNIDAAQTIALCAQHQKRIVDDVLTLSKLDSALLLVTPVDAQPLAVVQRALKMFENELTNADIELQFHVDASYTQLGLDWVRVDPSRVLQVLINLITNAVKFTTTQNKRTIVVRIAASRERPIRRDDDENDLENVNYFPSRADKHVDMTQGADWGEGEEVYIHFAVRDTGRGLTPEEKKLLFMRFSQASPRTHVQYGGSGLGLFISRELTELQGGEVGVASEAGKGSTFAFYVKARRSEAPKEEEHLGGLKRQPSDASAKARMVQKQVTGNNALQPPKTRDFAKLSPSPPSARGKDGEKEPLKVLIVEDNLVNQRVLQKQLRNMGCVTYVANHGGEALDRLKDSTYWREGSNETLGANSENADKNSNGKEMIDVVLMDQEMPVMDGLTCTRKIRELEGRGELVRHVPIIAVTANARSEQIQTAMNAGMDDVVSKPFRIPELIPKMEELVVRFSDSTINPP